MAKIDVQFAYVEDVLGNDRGVWALKTSEPHSRKNDRDEWETVSRTFRTLRVGKDSGIILDTFAKGDRISFTGTEKTDVREHNGKKYYDLLVWADTLTRNDGRGGAQAAPGVNQTAQTDSWSTPDVNGAQGGVQGFDSEVPF